MECVSFQRSFGVIELNVDVIADQNLDWSCTSCIFKSYLAVNVLSFSVQVLIMLFMSIAVTSLLAILGQGSILPRGRVFGGGTIVSPTSGSDAVAGQSIPFQYLDENGADACWSGYTTITVYLLAEPPSADDVSSSGTFTNFLYSFGNYTIPNFGGF